MRVLWNLNPDSKCLVLIQVGKAALLPQPCCQQENLAPVPSAETVFSTDFNKLVPQLWASSLAGELLPCRRPGRCVISATRGDACPSPWCWRMQAAFLPFPRDVGLTSLIFTFYWTTEMAVTKPKQLKAFSDPKIWGESPLKSCMRRQNSSHLLPLSFPPGWLHLNLSPKLTRSGDLVWWCKALYAEILMDRCFWSFSSKICVCGSHQHIRWVLSSFPAHPSSAGDAFYREYHSAAVSGYWLNFSLLFLCQKQSQPFCLHFEQCL